MGILSYCGIRGTHTLLHAAYICARESTVLTVLQNGDLFLQVRDILLHALAFSRKELKPQMKSCGIHLDDAVRESLLLKRAQFLLYSCRHAKQPTQVCTTGPVSLLKM